MQRNGMLAQLGEWVSVDAGTDLTPGGTDGKRDIRRRVRAARQAMPAGVRDAADQAITAAAVALARGHQVVAAYAPQLGEPGGPDLPEALAAVVGTLLLPVVCDDLDLDWASFDTTSGMVARGRLGLAEPVGPPLGRAAIVRAELVLVPAQAVALDGVRLGRGGGCYDRALVRVTPGTPVVALLYDNEMFDTLPADPHDRQVSAVLTPSGTRTIGAGSQTGTRSQTMEA